MNKEAAVQPVKEEVKAIDNAAPVVEENLTVTADPKKQVATAAAVGKVAAKPGVAKKVVAEKPVPAPKTPAKAAKKAPVTKEKAAEVPKPEKLAKTKKQPPKKPKLVRDSFTIPETDYALFATLKRRALAAGVEVKKGEVLRAALVVLAKLDDVELVKAIGLVERIKTGRPKK